MRDSVYALCRVGGWARRLNGWLRCVAAVPGDQPSGVVRVAIAGRCGVLDGLIPHAEDHDSRGRGLRDVLEISIHQSAPCLAPLLDDSVAP